MTIPPVMVLEMTLDTLKDRSAEVPAWPPLVEGGPKTTTRDREIKEFRMLGPARRKRIQMEMQLGGEKRYTQMELGYIFGLMVARMMLSNMPAAVEAGVTL